MSETAPAISPFFTFIDLFAGIGGFHVALERLGGKCVMACEMDKSARAAYRANFEKHSPEIFPDMFISDVRTLDGELLNSVPNFDILCAGFPCQPFSHAGRQHGFDDAERGNLFFDIMRIMRARRPAACILENVRNLHSHDNGRTFVRIADEISGIGYSMAWKILKASDYGVPQNRPRIYIVGFDREQLTDSAEEFSFPPPVPLLRNMNDIWGSETCDRTIGYTLRVGGRGSPYGNRHNWDHYLVDGTVRRLGPVQGRKMMGLPDNHVLSAAESPAMKQLGNSVAVPVVEAVGAEVLEYMRRNVHRAEK